MMLDVEGSRLKVNDRVVTAFPLWNALIELHKGTVVEVADSYVKVQLDKRTKVQIVKQGKTPKQSIRIIKIENG